jgi:plastocyanin
MGGGTRWLIGGVAVLLLAGCGSPGYAPTSLTTVQPAADTAGGYVPTGAIHPAGVVSMRQIAFTPRTITIHVGQTVEWANHDNVLHNVTTVDGHTIVSPNLGPGGRFAFTARVPERINYYCTIHASSMIGTLIVER